MRFQALHRCQPRMLLAVALMICGASGTVGADEGKPGSGISTPSVQFADIKGQYEFAGGRLLTITGSQYKIHAQLDGRPDVMMSRSGASTFKAVDSSFELTFRQHENGTVTMVDLQETPDRTRDTKAASLVDSAGHLSQHR